MPQKASGKFVLRIRPELHEALKKAAMRRGLSLNDFCQRALQAKLEQQSSEQADKLTRALISAYGENLVGIVLFGSAARGELSTASDIDLLIIVQCPIERALYHQWDDSSRIQTALQGSSHLVSPQFVRMPEPPEDAGGIWLEAAVEGRILYDPSLEVSKTLTAIRKAILAGRFERSYSHGHPYWIRKKAG